MFQAPNLIWLGNLILGTKWETASRNLSDLDKVTSSILILSRIHTIYWWSNTKNYETYSRSARLRALTCFEQFWRIFNYIKPFSLYILVYLGLYWSISVDLGLSWSISAYHGLSLFILVYLCLSRAILGYFEISRDILGYIRLSLAILSYLLVSWAILGYLELFPKRMSYLGYLLLFPAISGFLRLSLSY